MRKLTDHIVEGDSANHQLTIEVQDESGAGGANHRYTIKGFDTRSNISETVAYHEVDILFQNGPIKEVGVNGVTHEALLAIVIDRLRSFQAGTFACEENEVALRACEVALGSLHERTEKRLARGVEGTHQK